VALTTERLRQVGEDTSYEPVTHAVFDGSVLRQLDHQSNRVIDLRIGDLPEAQRADVLIKLIGGVEIPDAVNGYNTTVTSDAQGRTVLQTSEAIWDWDLMGTSYGAQEFALRYVLDPQTFDILESATVTRTYGSMSSTASTSNSYLRIPRSDLPLSTFDPPPAPIGWEVIDGTAKAFPADPFDYDDDPDTGEGLDGGMEDGADAGTDPATDPGMDPATDDEADAGIDPATDPGMDPATDEPDGGADPASSGGDGGV
jgi:hypothetical protein